MLLSSRRKAHTHDHSIASAVGTLGGVHTSVALSSATRIFGIVYLQPVYFIFCPSDLSSNSVEMLLLHNSVDCNIPRVCSVRYRCSRYRLDVVPNLQKRSVPVLMYRTYRSVRCRFLVVQKLPKCPVPVCKPVPVPTVPVSMSYRTYRRVRYPY